MIRLAVPEIDEAEIDAVNQVLQSGFLVQGKHVARFEQMTADYLGIKHAVAVSSGTAALHLALIALGIGAGDEVIVPDFTFPATANVVKLTGAVPVLVDIDCTTMNVDVQQLEKLITPNTRAIMPVHLFGLAADMTPVMELAQQHNVYIIEDAACALGATYQGAFCGTLGDVGCFSYHPRKVITTGEGGMLVTNNDALADTLRQLRNHGITSGEKGIQFTAAGFNYRMTDFQGAMGAAQMQKLELIIQKRREIADWYQHYLGDIPCIMLPHEPKNMRHVWQSYVLLLDEQINRTYIMDRMREAGIETNIGTHAVSTQPFYADDAPILKNSLFAYRQSLCLPLHLRMSETDVKTVAEALRTEILRQQEK